MVGCGGTVVMFCLLGIGFMLGGPGKAGADSQTFLRTGTGGSDVPTIATEAWDETEALTTSRVDDCSVNPLTDITLGTLLTVIG